MWRHSEDSLAKRRDISDLTLFLNESQFQENRGTPTKVDQVKFGLD